MNNLTDSVGIVKPQKAVFDSPLQLDCGKELKKIELVYETYGSLNERKIMLFSYAMHYPAIIMLPVLTALMIKNLVGGMFV